MYRQIRVQFSNGTTVFAVEPLTAAGRQRGLLGLARPLPPSLGMLFPTDPRHPTSMTMVGMRVPLDMVFIGPTGRVGKVHEAHPGQVIRPPVGTAFVLETGRGVRCRPGDRVTLRGVGPRAAKLLAR